jgi:hypothetical protein
VIHRQLFGDERNTLCLLYQDDLHIQLTSPSNRREDNLTISKTYQMATPPGRASRILRPPMHGRVWSTCTECELSNI